MVTARTLAPRRPHWRTDRRGHAMTLSFGYWRVLDDIADAVCRATLAGCPSLCFSPAFEALEIQPIRSAAYPIVMADEPALQRQPTHAKQLAALVSTPRRRQPPEPLSSVLANARQEASNLTKQIKPAAASTTTPWHVSKPTFHQSDERSRPQLMSRTPRQ